MHGVLLDRGLALDSNDGGLGALGHDGNALSLGVLLGEVRERNGDFLDVCGAETVRLGVGGSLGFVANNVVPVGRAGIQGLLEELRDERSRERQDEGLVPGSGLLGKLLNGRGADYRRGAG